MTEQTQPVTGEPRSVAQFVAAGHDLSGEHRGLGISHIDFKLAPPDEQGVLIIENVFHAKGGPARHLHHAQDEWFMVLEGEFLFEVGEERMQLRPGDSLLAPRGVPHVWAFVGDGQGRILIAFLPAGRMESMFRQMFSANAMPPQDPALWAAHGLQLVGPPLPIE